jgi:hypothetical protein
MNDDYQTLKNQQLECAEKLPNDLNLKIHRSLSWLKRAEMSSDDSDSQFMFSWIAFNAAYSSHFEDNSERKTFEKFISQLCKLDSSASLNKFVKRNFSSCIKKLHENRYVFTPFWRYQNNELSYRAWQNMFNSSITNLDEAKFNKDIKNILVQMFSRLYILRNQTLHGSSTWNSSVNREQMDIGAKFMNQFIPLMLKIMLDNPNQQWGEPSYPFVDSNAA